MGVRTKDLLVHGEFRKSCEKQDAHPRTCPRCRHTCAYLCGNCFSLTSDEAENELAYLCSYFLKADFQFIRQQRDWLPLLPVSVRLAWDVFVVEMRLRAALQIGGYSMFLRARKQAKQIASEYTVALNAVLEDAEQYCSAVHHALKELAKQCTKKHRTRKNHVLVAWDAFVNAAGRWSMARGFLDDMFRDGDHITFPGVARQLADNCVGSGYHSGLAAIAHLLDARTLETDEEMEDAVIVFEGMDKPRVLHEVVQSLVLELRLRHACLRHDEHSLAASIKDAQAHLRKRHTKELATHLQTALGIMRNIALEKVADTTGADDASGLDLLRDIINCEKLGLHDNLAEAKVRYFDRVLRNACGPLPQWQKEQGGVWENLSARECASYEQKLRANEWSEAGSMPRSIRRIPLRLRYPEHWGDLNSNQTSVPSSMGTSAAPLSCSQGRALDDFACTDSDEIKAKFERLLEATTHKEREFHQCHKVLKARVIDVVHVKNVRLWNQYCFKRRRMRETINDICPLSPAVSSELCLNQCDRRLNETYLFHGTSRDKVPSICQRGFDTKLGSSLHGLSLNFSSHPCRALMYPTGGRPRDGTRTLIVARVLLGDPCYPTEVKPGLRRPENRREDVFSPYDCVVANPGPMAGAPGDRQVHRDFHVYDSMQTYPEYILTVQFPT